MSYPETKSKESCKSRWFVCSVFITVLLICAPHSISIGQDLLPYEISSGIVSYEEGDYYQAIRHLESAILKYPMRIEPYVYLASSYLGIEDYSETLTAANKGLQRFPDNIRLKLIQAEALYRSGDDAAIDEYLDILELFDKNEESETISGINLEQVKAALGKTYQLKANEAYQEGRSEEAINLYYKAREFIPDNVTIHNNLAYVLFENRRFEESLDVLIIATERFPDAENLNVLKGQIYSELENTDKLLEVYTGLYKNHPGNLDYAIIYGQLLMSTNKASQANLLFDKLITENPDEVRLYDLLIGMNEQRYDYGGKRNVLKLKRSAFPGDRMVAEELAETHVLIEEYDEARAIYDSLAVYHENEKYQIFSARTWVFNEEFDIALQEYQSVLAKIDGNQNLFQEAALLYKELDQPAKAIEMLIKADSLESEENIKLRIAHLLIDQGRDSEAQRYLSALQQSRYGSYSRYHEIKLTQNDVTGEELINEYKVIITDLISIYGELLDKFSNEASQSVNRIEPQLPKVFQQNPVLIIVENTIDDFFTQITTRFTFNESIRIIDYALNAHPNSAILHYQKGLLAYENEKPEDAITSFRKSIENGATDHNLYFLMGKIYARQGNTNQAILSFEQTLTLNPEFRDAYVQLIRVSQDNNQLDALCNRWLMKFEIDDQNNTLKQFLIEALHKADRFEEAREIIGRRL